MTTTTRKKATPVTKEDITAIINRPYWENELPHVRVFLDLWTQHIIPNERVLREALGAPHPATITKEMRMVAASTMMYLGTEMAKNLFAMMEQVPTVQSFNGESNRFKANAAFALHNMADSNGVRPMHRIMHLEDPTLNPVTSHNKVVVTMEHQAMVEQVIYWLMYSTRAQEFLRVGKQKQEALQKEAGFSLRWMS